jgi:hypothetical protein
MPKSPSGQSHELEDQRRTQIPTGRDYRTDAALRPQPKRSGPDLWPTPRSLIEAMVVHVLPTLPPGPIWECAAGPGDLVRALENAGREVIATDLHSDCSVDFLTSAPPAPHSFAAIASNGPFNQLDRFMARGVQLMDQGVAECFVLLLRHDHMMATDRVPLLNRASQILSCNWRARWIPGSTGCPRWTFSWFIWLADCSGPPMIRWVQENAGSSSVGRQLMLRYE